MNKERIDTLHHTNLIIPTIPYRYNLDIDCFQNELIGDIYFLYNFFNIVPEDFSFKIQVNIEFTQCYVGHPQSKEQMCTTHCINPAPLRS